MSYRVDYGPMKKVRGMEKRVSRRCALTGLFFLVFVVMVYCFWPEGKTAMEHLLLPGDRAVAAAAWEDFAGELRGGKEISESLRLLCVRILEGAGFDLHR